MKKSTQRALLASLLAATLGATLSACAPAVLGGAVLHAGWNVLVKSSGDKPLDTALIRELAQNHEVLVTVEEGSVGGFGSFVLRYLTDEGLLDGGLKVRTMVLPDLFIEHGKPEAMYEAAGLGASGIVATVFKALGRGNLAGEVSGRA